MSKNALIGLLAVAVVVIIAGGIYAFTINSPVAGTPMATSTLPGATQGNPVPSQNPNPTPITNPTPIQPAGVPSVTTDATATPSNSSVVVVGKVTPNGAQTSYWYEFGTTNALGSRTTVQTIGSGFVAINTPAYITRLNANTIYFYRLVAQNSLGTVNGATYSFSTNSNPPPQGNAPTTRTDTASNISRTSANVNGEANPNSAQTSYWFEYGESAGLGNVTAFQSAGAGATSMTTSVSLSNLKPLTKYYFRVNAQNQFGTVNGAILNFTTLGPAVPSAPAVTTSDASSVAASSATMNGQVNPHGDPTTYWFQYSLDSDLKNIISGPAPAQVSGSGTTNVAVSAKITGLQGNTKYYYRLVATNALDTVYGAIISFQTKR